MTYQKLKRRSYEILEKGESHDVWSRRVDYFIIVLILLNILAVIVESVKWLREDYSLLFYYIELFSISIFSIEYLIRIWSITEKEEYSHPIKGRLKYLISFLRNIGGWGVECRVSPESGKVEVGAQT